MAFEEYVARQFNEQIKNFHSDGRGEFLNSRLTSHFLTIRIVQKISCPYTPERRHKIIRELGMTMLFHCGAPLFLWVEALTTIVYLINRLPSLAINFKTPFFLLHGTHPVYFFI